MSRKVQTSFMIIGCVVLAMLAVVANAQPPRRQGPPPDGRDPANRGQRPDFDPEQRPGRPFFPGPQFDLMASEMRFDSKVVKGAPYSATAVTENLQLLADGTRISHKTTATIYRDSEGRTRREQTLNIAGPFAVSGEPPQMIFINDAVANVRYLLDARSHTARKMPSSTNAPPFGAPFSKEQPKQESLGKQTIEGIEAEGTRMTLTIPAGQIGNDRPIEIVSERWESTELNLVLLSKHKDPRWGETIYRLTNINRSEPAKSLFEVPSGYSTVEENPSNRRGRPGPGRGRRPGGIKFE